MSKQVLSEKAKRWLNKIDPLTVLLTIFATVAVIFWGGVFLGAIGKGHESWPKIHDPEKLLKDCELLLNNEGKVKKDIPREYWPESIKRIPSIQAVVVEEDHVNIMHLYNRRIHWGIQVYPDRRSKADLPSAYSVKMISPGIFDYNRLLYE